MQIQADRFLALTAMLAGFVPVGPQEGVGRDEQVERAGGAAQTPPARRPAARDDGRSEEARDG